MYARKFVMCLSLILLLFFQFAAAAEMTVSQPNEGVPLKSTDVVSMSLEEDFIEFLIDDDAILGDPNAPVTMVMFGGYWEVFSYNFWLETFPSIKSNYIDTGKVKFVFRDFPLESIIPQNTLAAEAAECVGEQGGDQAYFQMFNVLFASEEDPTYELFNQLASNLGYDIHTCLDTHAMAEEVQSDETVAVLVGVRGSPTFFVNERMIAGAHEYEVFSTVIDDELDEIDCYSESDCGEDGLVGNTLCVEDVVVQRFVNVSCVNAGTSESYCIDEEEIVQIESCADTCFQGSCVEVECYSDDECGEEETEYYCNSNGEACELSIEPYCEYPGSSNSMCSFDEDEDCTPCENGCADGVCIDKRVRVDINYPMDDILSERRIILDIELSETVEELYYIDINEGKSIKRTLCRNCDSYSRSRTFGEGYHDFTAYAMVDKEIMGEESVEFTIDSKKPRISKVEPRGGFTRGYFTVEFNEENPENLMLYGEDTLLDVVDIESECVKERVKTVCEFYTDLQSYDGEEIEYWFKLEDIAENQVSSKKMETIVDITPPIINEITADVGRRGRVTFNAEIEESYFEELTFTDNGGREVKICSRLRDGNCKVSKRLQSGTHDIIFTAYDSAGNSATSEMSLVIV